MDKRRIELLQGMPIFGGVADSILDLFLQRASEVSVPGGEYFFREGDPGGSTFVLEAGSVAILKTWKGRNYLLRELGKGDCFGEMALIDFGPRSASVLANEDSSAIELSSASLREIRKADLEQFTLIYMNMARELSRRLRSADARLFEWKVETDVAGADLRFHSV
jgi:CRP-like cAMP-binding protein